MPPPAAREESSLAKWLWLGLFALMYPMIITFSLLFTGLLWVFSQLSRAVTFVLRRFSRE